MPAQSNSVTASFFFIAVLVADCLTAIDSTDHADVPSSLRATCIALLCCFAAPVLIRPERGVYGWLQRPVIGSALLASALVGVHHGGSATRTFDAIYTTLVCVAVTWLFSAGGVDEAARTDASKGAKIDKAISTSSTMLAGSLLLYGSVRIMRAGLRHPAEVREFRVSPSGNYNASSSIQTLGYAYASDVATIAVTFGGAVGLGAAVTMVYHVHELASGTGVVAMQLGVSATFQIVAALAASLTYGDQVNWLPAVFGETACSTNSDACEAAATSRRFASINTQVPGLWLSALGLFCLAYPTSSRFTDVSQVSNYVWDFAGSLFGLAAVTAALLLLYVYCDFSGPGAHTDYIVLITVFAVYWSVFWDTYVGSLVYVAAFITEEVLYVRDYGFEVLFSHLTHVTLVFGAVVLMFSLLLQTVAFVYRPRWLQVLIGMSTAAGSSLSLALYCASACLLMINNGSLGNLQDTDDGARFSISFILQHFVPVLVWAPLYTCRCEIQLLSRVQRLSVWLLVLPVDLAIYAACLSVLGVAAPTAAIMDMGALWGCLLGAGVLPWLAASSV